MTRPLHASTAICRVLCPQPNLCATLTHVPTRALEQQQQATQAVDFTDAERATFAQIYAAEVGVHVNAVAVTTAPSASGGGYTITATVTLRTRAEAEAAKSALEAALATADDATTFLSQDDALDVTVSGVAVGEVSAAVVVSNDRCEDLGQCDSGGGGAGGAVAGVVVGGLLFVGLVAGAVTYFRKQQAPEIVPLSPGVPGGSKPGAPKLEGTSKI